MPVGWWINAMNMFNAMMPVPKKKWSNNFEVKYQTVRCTEMVPNAGNKQIVDSMFLHLNCPNKLLSYFQEVLVVLRKC